MADARMGYGTRKRKRGRGNGGGKRRRVYAPRRKAILGELKFHDLDIDDAVVAVNGNIARVSCLTIAEGNGESDRVGRKITVRHILWRYVIKKNAEVNVANPVGNDTIRVILYWDKQTNGATATVTGILESDDFQSFRNLSNTGRFQILHDRTWSVNLQAGAGDGAAANDWTGETKSHIMSKQCVIPIEYDNSATTGVITTMRSNNLGVLLLSETGAALFNSKMRIRYSDL